MTRFIELHRSRSNPAESTFLQNVDSIHEVTVLNGKTYVNGQFVFETYEQVVALLNDGQGVVLSLDDDGNVRFAIHRLP